MKNLEKKIRWSLAMSVTSLLLIVTMICMWICETNKLVVVSLDSFVGVEVALLAIIVTVTIGWHIYNVIEVKSQIIRLDNLEQTFTKQQNTFEEFVDSAQCENLLNIAEIRATSEEYEFAFMYAMESLVYGLNVNSHNIAHILKLLGKYEKFIRFNTILPKDSYERIVLANQKIRKSPFYNIIAAKYEEPYNHYIDKVRKGDKSAHEVCV